MDCGIENMEILMYEMSKKVHMEHFAKYQDELRNSFSTMLSKLEEQEDRISKLEKGIYTG